LVLVIGLLLLEVRRCPRS